MNPHRSRDISRLLVGFAVVLCAINIASAATPHEKVLYSFQGGNDGASPLSDLIADKDGNLYGTTVYGGTGLCTDSDGFVIGCGTVFKLVKPAVAGGKWTETVLYSFQGITNFGNDSEYPKAGLTFDAAGHLYGTTAGTNTPYDNGTVFQLSRPSTKGGAWTKTVLYSFKGGYDGDQPQTKLVFDNQGRIYGTTSDGAPLTGGTVFRLTPPVQVGGAWTVTPLYAFSGGTDGQTPMGIVLDVRGNIFGTTSAGGGFSVGGDQYSNVWAGGGTFFEITPAASQSKPWNETLPFIFPPCVANSFLGGESCGNSTQPESGLIADAAGNLYGTTEIGGNIGVCYGRDYYEIGCGTVFQFVRPAAAGGAWTQNILYAFGTTTTDGAFPVSRLAFDQSGNLYGATLEGCQIGACSSSTSSLGNVFQLSPPTTKGGNWTETVLYQFQGGNDGALPVAGLLVRGNALYSTTQYGGTGNCLHMVDQPSGCGTVFEISH